ELLAWHGQPNPEAFPPVRNARKNHFGAAGLTGLVWEWTEDFNASLVTGESRDSGSEDLNLFCGGGGLRANDTSDYPRFLRYGYRTSLQADYTVRNLGFRCAKDAP